MQLKYHAMWRPKYRGPVLVKPADARLKELLGWKPARMELTIGEIAAMPDRVNLFVLGVARICAAEIVNGLKGFNSPQRGAAFPFLRSRWPTLWSRSCYAGSVGSVSEARVRKHIQSQKGKEMRFAYKYRLHPSKAQAQLLKSHLREASSLYNAAKQERDHAWKTRQKSINYYDQAYELKAMHADGVSR
jgi:putative transposase